MKNINYTLLTIALVFCFSARAQDTISIRLPIQLQVITAQCPDGSLYSTLDEAKKTCGNKATKLSPKVE